MSRHEVTDEAFIGDMIAMIGQELPTLRDRFAIAALPCATQAAFELRKSEGDGFNQHDIARLAYSLADAMMTAREVK